MVNVGTLHGAGIRGSFSALCPRTHPQFRPANGGVLRDVDDIPFVPDEHETTILEVLNLGSRTGESRAAGNIIRHGDVEQIDRYRTPNIFMSLDCHLSFSHRRNVGLMVRDGVRAGVPLKGIAPRVNEEVY